MFEKNENFVLAHPVSPEYEKLDNELDKLSSDWRDKENVDNARRIATDMKKILEVTRRSDKTSHVARGLWNTLRNKFHIPDDDVLLKEIFSIVNQDKD